MLMFEHRFGNATRVSSCEYNWWTLENLKNELKDTHIPYIENPRRNPKSKVTRLAGQHFMGGGTLRRFMRLASLGLL